MAVGKEGVGVKKPTKIMVLTAAAITICIIPMVFNLQKKLTYNPSPSAPTGLYWIRGDAPLEKGVYVIAPMPPQYKMMAAQRHYIPLNIPLLKRVVALFGDKICRHGEVIFVNDKPAAIALKHDSQGRKLPVWQGCFVLKKDQFFALMDASDSFDGRYFGPLNKKDVIGIAVPIFVK